MLVQQPLLEVVELLEEQPQVVEVVGVVALQVQQQTVTMVPHQIIPQEEQAVPHLQVVLLVVLEVMEL